MREARSPLNYEKQWLFFPARPPFDDQRVEDNYAVLAKDDMSRKKADWQLIDTTIPLSTDERNMEVNRILGWAVSRLKHYCERIQFAQKASTPKNRDKVVIDADTAAAQQLELTFCITILHSWWALLARSLTVGWKPYHPIMIRVVNPLDVIITSIHSLVLHNLPNYNYTLRVLLFQTTASFRHILPTYNKSFSLWA